jgi:Ubiquitin family
MARSKATATARATKSNDRKAARSSSGNDDDDETARRRTTEPAKNHNKKRKAVSSESESGESNGTAAAADGAGKEGDLRASPPPAPRDEEEDNDNDSEPCCFIKIPNRMEIFPVPDTWWMVDLHAHPTPTQGATPLVQRCMRELGWTEVQTRSVLRAYRQFLSVKVAAKDWDAQLMSPSREVDQMWRQHVLDNVNYAHDCLLLCGGHFVTHDPDDGVDVEARKERLEATRQALLEYFGDDEKGGGGGELDRSATGPWKEVFEPDEGTDEAQASGGGGEDSGGAWLRLVVASLTGRETQLRVRPTDRMGRVFAEYSRLEGVPVSECRFVFRGRHLEAGDALEALGLHNGDRMHVVLKWRGC